LVFGNINCRDLIALKNSIGMLPYIKDSLSDLRAGIFSYVAEKFDSLEDVYNLIDVSIIDDPPITIKEGGIIKSGYSDEVAELRDALENGKKWILDIENREREATGIKSLKIGFNKVFGYYIDVTRANSSLVPDSYIRKQTLANSERYITPELKELEEKVLGAEDKIKIIEYDIFNEVKNKILLEVNRIKNMGKLIATVDVITSFSEVAFKNSYCKPEVSDSSRISIVEGRHPVVEKLVKTEMFVSNDTILDNDDNRMYIITGPNMAGKSTYLRQVALITLMAQIGSFVPAKEAFVGVVDRIFTRVGASDDLSQGQSTFMVEMSELANILHNASSKSLIILDEIGRGTSTYDGLSIAWAVVEFLSKNSGIRSKSMFATHYHELTEIEGKIDGVRNYSILAKEVGDDIVFLRKIVKGRANQSFGIQVAKLAGVPHSVTERATQILRKLEENDINSNIKNLKDDPQISFFNEADIFSSDEKEVIDIIRSVDVGNTTPIDALNILYNLRKKID
jgi:DNA mismatch repair protein MutS